MTTIILPEPLTLPDCDNTTWGRIGPFTWDLWEGEQHILFGVWHDSLLSVLAFFRKPGECKQYITSGGAAADYEQTRTERRG